MVVTEQRSCCLSLASLEPAEFAEKRLSFVLFFGAKKQDKNFSAFRA
jgi:hypothetical protein